MNDPNNIDRENILQRGDKVIVGASSCLDSAMAFQCPWTPLDVDLDAAYLPNFHMLGAGMGSDS